MALHHFLLHERQCYNFVIPVAAEKHSSVIAAEKIAHVIDFRAVSIRYLVWYRGTLYFKIWVRPQQLLLLLNFPECCQRMTFYVR